MKCRIGQLDRCETQGYCSWWRVFHDSCYGKSEAEIDFEYINRKNIEHSLSESDKINLIQLPKYSNKNLKQPASRLHLPIQPLPINEDNFFVRTRGYFIELTEIPQGFTKFFSSKGSEYYSDQSKQTLIRVSDHWGEGVALCSWFLSGYQQIISFKWKKNYGKDKRIGIIKYSDLIVNDAYTPRRDALLRFKKRRPQFFNSHNQL